MKQYSFLQESLVGTVIGATVGSVIGGFISYKLNENELYRFILMDIERDPSKKEKYINEVSSWIKEEIAKINKILDAYKPESDHVNEYYNYGVVLKILEQKLKQIESSASLDNKSFAKLMTKNCQFCRSLKKGFQDIHNDHKWRNRALVGGGVAAGIYAAKKSPQIKKLAKSGFDKLTAALKK